MKPFRPPIVRGGSLQRRHPKGPCVDEGQRGGRRRGFLWRQRQEIAHQAHRLWGGLRLWLRLGMFPGRSGIGEAL